MQVIFDERPISFLGPHKRNFDDLGDERIVVLKNIVSLWSKASRNATLLFMNPFLRVS
jgi:hypothetical protein